ncbi:palmitoyltransferase ZDHHC20-A-like isoform X2 [Siniperca chuatsi]|uniref:palmitoyltransferase ZDHHC20-A-like isoform X2 n=1 Tax=Siniperca chuatsi TaxID=119488 RepID=UPI001CE0D45B|nr:palmitoyltransferase ZDHHC20-A-like isoform X2 [Siniperca chuatsi]
MDVTSPSANVFFGLKMAPSHALRCCKRALNWIPVLFINLVVGWSYYAYVVELCVYTIPNNAERISYLVIFHIFLTMFIWSYWKTIRSRPASPSKAFGLPRAEKELYEREERAETQQEILKKVARNLPVYTRTAGGAIRYCDHCQVIKPDRCHHCSTCEMCVLKMDHHCPWKQLPDTHAKFHILFLFFVAALFFISILSLLSYHLWLVGKNRTTIEAFRAPVFTNGPDKNGFSLGFSRNVSEVFGEQAKYWMFPVFSSLGDGHSFVTRLLHIDPEQANSVLQQNGKSPADGEANSCVLGNNIQHIDSKEKIDGGQIVSVTMESEP